MRGDRTVPYYRKQKRAGRPPLAFVSIGGERRFLGVYGTPESRRRYDALVAEICALNGQYPPKAEEEVNLIRLVDYYLLDAKKRYRKPDGLAISRPAGCVQVDAVAPRHEVHAPLEQLGEQRGQALRRAAQPVQPPHHDAAHLARADRVRELVPGSPCASAGA